MNFSFQILFSVKNVTRGLHFFSNHCCRGSLCCLFWLLLEYIFFKPQRVDAERRHLRCGLMGSPSSLPASEPFGSQWVPTVPYHAHVYKNSLIRSIKVFIIYGSMHLCRWDGTVGCHWQPSGFAGGNYDGGPIRVKAKYSESISRARGFFFESSINSGDTDNGNKQKNIFLLPSAQYWCSELLQKCTQMPLWAWLCCFWCHWWRLSYHAISVA